MELIYFILMVFCTLFVAGCNYTYNPNIGNGIILRLFGAIFLVVFTIFWSGYHPITSTETDNSLTTRIYQCRNHLPPEQNCNGIIVIKVK